MTKEELEKAIDLLDNLLGMVEDNQDNDYDFALKMGIESLRKEPYEDCVSRQAVIDALDKRFDSVPMEQTTEILLLRKDLRELPPVTPTQKWIPCSERLPEIHNRAERYFVTLKCGDIDIAKFIECNGEHWWNFNYDDVVAWMPLPNPYQEDEPLLNYADQDTMKPAT